MPREDGLALLLSTYKGFFAGDAAPTWIKQLSLTPTAATGSPEVASLSQPESSRDVQTAEAPLVEGNSPSAGRPRLAAQVQSNRPAAKIRQAFSTNRLPWQPIGIGLCVVGILAAGGLYRNWSRLPALIGRPVIPSDRCSADFLAVGGALEEFDLSCLNKDPEAIATLWIERTADNPNQLDMHRETLLQTALKTRKSDLARRALEHGVDPNLGEERDSPLALAVIQKNLTLVELLINWGADVTYSWTVTDEADMWRPSRERSENALTLALQVGDLDMVQQLLDAGMPYAGDGSIGLAQMAETDDFEILTMLIAQGFDVNEGDTYVAPPLEQAIKQKNVALVEFLLDQGAMLPDQRLNQVVSTNPTEIAALLSARGAQIEGQPVAAVDAAQSSQVGVRPEAQIEAEQSRQDNNDGSTVAGGQNSNELQAVMDAINQGDRPLLERLISQGVNLNQTGSSGQTPLTAAITKRSQVAATLLLEKGAQLNFPDARETPLTAAIEHEQWEIVDQLLTRGANYTQAAPNGQTPLNQAISKNNTQLVKRLLDLGADPNQKGDNDYTPLMATLQPIGQPPKETQIIQALLDSGAELGKNEMFRAIRDDHLAIVRLFLDHGWGINATVYDNHTPLSAAVGYSTPAMAQLMLDRGANTTWRGHHNFTLMDLAKERDSQEMIRFLRSKGIF